MGKDKDNRLTKIEGIAYTFDDKGVVTIEQGYDMGNDGDVSRIELHPVLLRMLAEEAGLIGKPSAGLVPDSVVGRLCVIADRMDALQQELLKLDLLPYVQPSDLGGVVLSDLDQLLYEFGVSTEKRKDRAEADSKPAKSPEPGTTGSLL